MIAKLDLQNFRNFKKKSLEFSDGITVIVGDNAVGKTNILESLSLLSTGKSFKAKVEGEMLRYNQELARISGDIGDVKLEGIITKGENGWPKKRLLVNGVPKRLIDFAGNFKTVLFGPWDMDLVTETPSLRRKFLDTILSQTDREYRRNFLSYEKGLRQRNRLLFNIRENGASRSQLLFWNQLLIKNGDYISNHRREFIEFVNDKSNQLSIHNLQLEYDPSAISEGRLEQYKNEEVASATTLVGPHRDDFTFVFEGRNLASFGSRGEQRMGILWLKMAELNFVEEKAGERPTLLLDDIFSELDHEHRDIVMEVATKQQTIITTADEHFVENFDSKGIIKL
ncbi:MAG TPA: DNA replication and repair protein RecF [Patescibacteria group bacterium]|nr:DNA replication and repair protein RecF [Patescibacteria group bacterium]